MFQQFFHSISNGGLYCMQINGCGSFHSKSLNLCLNSNRIHGKSKIVFKSQGKGDTG